MTLGAHIKKLILDPDLTLYTLTSVCIFSILFSIQSLCPSKGNLFNNQEVFQFIIISFILMTLMLDSGMILKGEIRCWSLLGIKGLTVTEIQKEAREHFKVAQISNKKLLGTGNNTDLYYTLTNFQVHIYNKNH